MNTLNEITLRQTRNSLLNQLFTLKKEVGNISPINEVHPYPVQNLPLCYLPQTPLGEPGIIFILGAEKEEEVEYSLENNNGDSIGSGTSINDFDELLKIINDSKDKGWKIFPNKSIHSSLKEITDILDLLPLTTIEPRKVVKLSGTPKANLNAIDFTYKIDGDDDVKNILSYESDNQILVIEEEKDTQVIVAYIDTDGKSKEERLTVTLSQVIQLKGNLTPKLTKKNFIVTKSDGLSLEVADYNFEKKQLTVSEEIEEPVTISYSKVPFILSEKLKDNSWNRIVKLTTNDIMEDSSFSIFAERKKTPTLKTYLTSSVNYTTTFDSNLNISFKNNEKTITELKKQDGTDMKVEIQNSLDKIEYQVIFKDDIEDTELSNFMQGTNGLLTIEPSTSEITKDGIIEIRVKKRGRLDSESIILNKKLIVTFPVLDKVFQFEDKTERILDIPFGTPPPVKINTLQSGIIYELRAIPLERSLSIEKENADYDQDGTLKEPFESNLNKENSILVYQFARDDNNDGIAPSSGEIIEEDSVLVVRATRDFGDNKFLPDHLVVRVEPNPNLDLIANIIEDQLRVTIENSQPGVGYQIQEVTPPGNPSIPLGVALQMTGANRLGWESHGKIFGMPIHSRNELPSNSDPGNYFKIEQLTTRSRKLEFIFPIPDQTTTYEILAIKEYTGLEVVLNKKIKISESNNIEIIEES